MALDLVVERRKHEPIETVSVEVEVYGDLMSVVMPLRPRAFLRLADYYEDAEIPVEELRDLADEAGRVLRSASASVAVKDLARRIQSLAKTAIREGLPIHAYSD